MGSEEKSEEVTEDAAAEAPAEGVNSAEERRRLVASDTFERAAPAPRSTVRGEGTSVQGSDELPAPSAVSSASELSAPPAPTAVTKPGMAPKSTKAEKSRKAGKHTRSPQRKNTRTPKMTHPRNLRKFKMMPKRVSRRNYSGTKLE